MAGVYWSTYVENVAASITGALTFVQIIPAANARVRLKRIGIYGQGISIADVPVTFELVTQTSVGTSAALAVNKLNVSDDETLQVTALQAFTAEPTGNTPVFYSVNVASTGRHEWVWPIGYDFFVKGGTRLGLRALQASQASMYTILMEGEE